MSRPRLIRSNVRWEREMDEPQLRCESCATKGGPYWWPLTKEFWDPRLGFARCRACHNAARRKARRAAMDPNAKQRQYYREHREHRLAWVHDYRARNRERINELRRAAYARRVAANRQPGLFDDAMAILGEGADRT